MVKFGTDGIRGEYGVSLTDSVAYKLGQSLGKVLNVKRLVVGMDTRKSSQSLADNVIEGARKAGVDVMFAGIVSTPLISHYSRLKNVAGVMITASHNPYQDNGLKVFQSGEKCSLEEELAIERFINSYDIFEAETYGEIYSGEDVLDAYLDLIESMDLYETELKIGLDSANGANYLIARGIFQDLSDEISQIGCDPTGENINLGVGSTHIEAIQKLVKEDNLDIGFTFDGDGDRVLVVDNEGTLYDGDQIIYIIANYLKQLGLLKKDTVVLTKMSNLGIIHAFNKNGINVVLTDVGDKYVLREMKENDYSLGGENSGHVIYRKYLETGDGLLIALLLLKIVVDQQTTLKELTKDIKMWPQVLKNLKNVDKRVLELDPVKDKVNSIKNTLGNNGKVFLRPSGTEPVIRITISCKTQDLVDKYMNEIIKVIEENKEALK